MKYKRFYSRRGFVDSGKLTPQILEHIDAAHKEKMQLLIQELDHGAWTKKQKKRQKSSIISNIALYKTFIDNGIPAQEAKELVKEYSFYIAGKAHRILNTLFHIPGFFKLFRFFMRKGMTGEEIWISKTLADNAHEYSMDVLKCLWFDTCTYFNCPEICEIFCLCDHIVFGNIKKLQFDRSETLGMGGKKCDFCFHSKTNTVKRF